jgi:hypothetical protein
MLMCAHVNHVTFKHHSYNREWAILQAAARYLETLGPGVMKARSPGGVQMALAITQTCVDKVAASRLFRFMSDHDLDISMGRNRAAMKARLITADEGESMRRAEAEEDGNHRASRLT